MPHHSPKASDSHHILPKKKETFVLEKLEILIMVNYYSQINHLKICVLLFTEHILYYFFKHNMSCLQSSIRDICLQAELTHCLIFM